MITSQQVDEAYQRRDLLKLIRDRFKLTLQLDQRYEVIAYVIAWGSALYNERGMIEGFEVSWIRKQSLDFWPEGFKDTSHDDLFSVLLQEMEGLGVLRVTAQGNYALRSPNVGLLMGTLKEIESALEMPRQAPTEYIPAKFRPIFRKNNNTWYRSPLAAQQEARLRNHEHGINIVFGTNAAGLNDLVPYIRESFAQEKVFVIERGFSLHRFLTDFSNAVDNRMKDGVSLIVVSENCNWDETWIAEAMKKLERLSVKKSFVQVLFVADPKTTRILIDNASDFLSRLNKNSMLHSFSLSPWQDVALDQWLVDCEFPLDQNRDQISQITGNWPALLYQFYEVAVKTNGNTSQAIQILSDSLTQTDILDDICTSFALRDNEVKQILRIIAEWQESSAGIALDELSVLIDGGIPENRIRKAIQWGEILYLIRSEVNEQNVTLYRLDPIVAQILRQLSRRE